MPSSSLAPRNPTSSVIQSLKMNPVFAAILSQILSWRTLAVILALLNLKSLPFAWHLRLFGLSLRHGRSLKRNKAFLERESSPSLLATQKRIHPIFRPVSIACQTSLYETDYNFHKSNSTYFADLDHSRTALVASLVGPALARSTLKEHGEKAGVLYPILGSVHTSFLREIKPLEAYTVRSRLLGWDRKWLVILSCFVRPATTKEKAKANKQQKLSPADGIINDGEILLACALNKYVIKHGRKTIEPGLALAGSGWFRARPGTTHAVVVAAAATAQGEGGTTTSTSTNTEATTEGPNQKTATTTATTTGSNTPQQIPYPSKTSVELAETVSKVVRRFSNAAENSDLRVTPSTNTDRDLNTDPKANGSTDQAGDTTEERELGNWTWKEIDDERSRGLKIAEAWLRLDADLKQEYLDGLVWSSPSSSSSS